MLTRLTLKNFRCFDEEDIDLSRFTIFVGENNHGKTTASIRGPKLLLQNKGWPSNVIRHGETMCQVTLTNSSGHTLTRSLNKSKSKTYLNGAEYTGIKGLDEKIEKAFRFNHKIPEFENIHFVGRDGGYRFMNLTGPKLAKKIGVLSGYLGLSEAKASITTDIRQIKSKLDKEILPNILESSEFASKSLYGIISCEYLDEINKYKRGILIRLYALRKDLIMMKWLEELQKKREAYAHLIKKIEHSQKDLQKVKLIQQIDSLLEEIKISTHEFNKAKETRKLLVTESINHLNLMISKIGGTTSRIDNTRSVLEELLVACRPEVCEACGRPFNE